MKQENELVFVNSSEWKSRLLNAMRDIPNIAQKELPQKIQSFDTLIWEELHNRFKTHNIPYHIFGAYSDSRIDKLAELLTAETLELGADRIIIVIDQAFDDKGPIAWSNQANRLLCRLIDLSVGYHCHVYFSTREAASAIIGLLK